MSALLFVYKYTTFVSEFFRDSCCQFEFSNYQLERKRPTTPRMAAPMSDVSGYRSDGGGLGQDQGLSKQLRGVMTAKLPLLSAPGTVLENSLYYDINSSSVTAVEEQATF